MGSNSLVVTKHNHLIEASYKLNLNEQRLILACITQLDSRKPLSKDNIFVVTAKDFASMFGTEEKHAYEALNEAASNLYERDIRTYDGKQKERFRWIYTVKYHENEGKVTLGFSPSVAPYLAMLHKRFTSYNLKQIACVKSAYSIRIFEFLMQFKATGKLIIDLKQFRDRLELTGEYPRFCDLKRRVISKSVKELKEKSNFIVDWKPIKTGRTVTQIEFNFKNKEI